MKKFILLTFMALASHAQASGLGGIYCEREAPLGNDSLASYSMKVIEVQELPSLDYDYRREAVVQLIREVRQKATVLKEFRALVQSMDVHYFVDAQAKEGFFFSLYLDDGDGVKTITDSAGYVTKTNYACSPLN